MSFHHNQFDNTRVNTTSKYLSKILIATPKLEHLEEVKVQETGNPSKSVSGSDLPKTLILDKIFDLNTAN